MQTEGIDLSIRHLFTPLTEGLNDVLPRIPNALVVLVIGLLLIRLISWVTRWFIRLFRMPKGLKEIIMSLLDALLTVFLVIQVLQALGLSSLAFAFTAAVAALGLALGNGSVTMVQDILAGIYLARDRDFSVGDIVIAGESSVQGEIMSMDMRRIRIMDAEGRIHSLPNSVVERKEYVLITKKRDRKA
jgi:small-conductance mechanosensitive channel